MKKLFCDNTNEEITTTTYFKLSITQHRVSDDAIDNGPDYPKKYDLCEDDINSILNIIENN